MSFLAEPAYCAIGNAKCVNPPPAGFDIGGKGAAKNHGPPRTRWRCSLCGEPACRKCRRWINTRYEGRQDCCDSCADDELAQKRAHGSGSR